jgi:hypothetical protein
MNTVRQQPSQPRTIEEERVAAGSEAASYEASFTHEPGKTSMHAVKYPDGHTALVSQANLRGALACGGTVIGTREEPKMSPTINGAPGPRIHVLR